MSCMLLGTENLNIIADFLAVQMNQGFNYTGVYANEKIKIIFRDCIKNSFFNAEMIFNKLHEENIKAYNGRYKEITEPCVFYKESEKIRPRCIDKKWHIELYKRLQCYTYQLDEDATHNGEIIKALTEIKNSLAATIIDEYIPEYKNISWSL